MLGSGTWVGYPEAAPLEAAGDVLPSPPWPTLNERAVAIPHLTEVEPQHDLAERNHAEMRTPSLYLLQLNDSLDAHLEQIYTRFLGRCLSRRAESERTQTGVKDDRDDGWRPSIGRPQPRTVCRPSSVVVLREATQRERGMANTWTAFTNLPGGLQPDTMFLLTDGTVLVHNANGKDWYRLTPDSQGNYETGTWSAAIHMTNTRQFFASGILRDGRVFAIGGEYSDSADVGGGTAKGEMFDPTASGGLGAWSTMNKPSTFNWINKDATSCILVDGRVLLGDINSARTAIWDPDSDSWTEAGLGFGTLVAPSKVGNPSDEETWTLLPDGTVLAVEVANPPAAEKYNPSTDTWTSAGNTPANLPLSNLNDPITKTTVNIQEIGPALLLPNGTVFCIGATGNTAIYTPPAAPAGQGTWAAGAALPADTSGNNFNQANGNVQTAIDAPAVLLPNGRVLLIAGNTRREVNNGAVQFWSNPCTAYTYDPAANATPTQLNPQPPNNGVDTWQARMLLLPNGRVLFSDQQTSMSILTPDPATAAPNAAWKPTITAAPTTMVAGRRYVISGTQLNGLSQAVSYGDDAPAATNYPIVRLTQVGGNSVYYLRTFDFSTLGVATGTAIHSTSAQVPGNVPAGQYNLQVIANGIASEPAGVRVVAQDCFFVVDRSTFGQGEVQALIVNQGAPAIFDPALYVVVEGFKPSDLGLNAGNLANPPNAPVIAQPATNMFVEFSGGVIPEDPALPPSPQRFTFRYRVRFTDSTSMFGFAGLIEPLTLQATLTAGGTTVTAPANIELVKNPNPFILHGDTAHGQPWYLSVDARVFQMKASQTRFAATVGSTGTARSIATTFIQQAITNLNGSPGSAGALFDALPTDENATSLALAPNDVHGVPVYNFVLARVRLRDVVAAPNVRLFFRMYQAQGAMATYDNQTLYRSGTNASGQKIALLGVRGPEIMTIPFFATPRIDTSTASMTSQTDAPNVQPINASAIGGEVDAYYGAWLDINQPTDLLFPSRLVGPIPANLPDGPFNGMGALLPIQQLVRSVHQCLIAEISFDPDPIPTSADPSTSDKLAQRNLAFVAVANPGLLDSRRAPQTFEVRLTPRALPQEFQPDELMVLWGAVPNGTEADIYLPQADADEILHLAAQMYASHRLTKADAHTIRCQATGVTFVPLPRGNGNLTGLLTVDFPQGVREGQVHHIVVRQLTTALGPIVDTSQVVTALTTRRRSTPARGRQAAATEGMVRWRRVIGMFRLSVSVETKQQMLPEEERLLSVLRWIEGAVPAADRWFLVFKRYVEQIAHRVHDLGGDPDQIKPDPDGQWHTATGDGGKGEGEGDHGEKVVAFTGKVSGIVYDRFGDFIGFRLNTEDGERHFESREEELEALVQRAWAERIVVTVLAERHDLDSPVKLILRGRHRVVRADWPK